MSLEREFQLQQEVKSLRQQLAELEAQRDNAWEELREIRAAISANPEESTLDEVVKLRQQLATFRSAVEHVTEDGCTRRSFVAMPEGWAMVHKDRLHDLELAEEQLADVRNQVLEECAAVAEDTAAGRDAEAIADAIRAMKRCISQ